MKFLRALFSEGSQVSMMRVMSLLALLMGGYLAYVGKDACVSIFVIAAFGGKVLQKGIEIKS